MKVTAELNQPAPDFELHDLNGRIHRLHEYRGWIVILNFWSCECPHSQRTDAIILAKLAEWRGNAVMLSIAANRNESTQMAETAAKTRGLPTVLMDTDLFVADLFEAQTTPHVFVVDREGILRYRGAVDNVSFRQKSPTRFFLNEAVGALIEGRLPALSESPAYGCAIVREI